MSSPDSIAALATRRPVAVCVSATAVALVGWLAWQQLPVDLLPDLHSPTVVVSVRSGDRPPTEMERLYGEQIEQRLFTVRGIREVSQVARTGRLVATVVFDWDADLDLGLIDVQKAVGPVSADPDVDEVLVRRFDPRQAPILTLGLVAPDGRPDLAELRRLARRQVAPGLEQLRGVAEVRVTGGREQEVRVLLDRYRLDAFGITLAEVESRLVAENVDISAGTLEEGSQVYLVRGMSRFRRVEDVERVVVRYLTTEESGRQAIRVSDLGSVSMVDREIDHLVRVNGVEGVGLAIFKEAGSNTVQVSTVVRDALAGLTQDLPNVELTEVTDDASLVVDALADLRNAAVVGVLLAVAVLFLFLRSAGATLIVTAAVPVSIFAALFLMRFADQSLNIVTLGGLALGAGMLVDNAIVVVESIYRRLGEGDSALTAAATGTSQVAGAITASTLTTCVVFVPVLFVEGLAARLIEGIAFAVVASLLASLAVAMLLIPALARWFLPKKTTTLAGTEGVAIPAHRRGLETLVRGLLRYPLVTVALATVIAGLSGWMLLGLGTELLPPSDPRQFSVRVVGPPGQRVESTARVVEGIEGMLRQAAAGELRAVLSEVGRLPEDDRTVRTELAEENTARLTVRMSNEGPDRPATRHASDASARDAGVDRGQLGGGVVGAGQRPGHQRPAGGGRDLRPVVARPAARRRDGQAGPLPAGRVVERPLLLRGRSAGAARRARSCPGRRPGGRSRHHLASAGNEPRRTRRDDADVRRRRAPGDPSPADPEARRARERRLPQSTGAPDRDRRSGPFHRS